MNSNFLYMASNNLIKTIISTDNIFYRNTCHGQLVSQLLSSFGEIYIIMKPLY